jgi:ATP-binding cassette subfamily B protein
MSLDHVAPLPPESGGALAWVKRLGTQARSAVRDLPRVLGLVYRSSPGLTVGIAVLTVLVALQPLAVAYAGKRIVDAVVARSRADGLRWVIIELLLMAAHVLTVRALDLGKQLLGARLSIDVHLRILGKAQSLELRHFEDAEFYDKLTRARREAGSRPVQVVTEGLRIAQNALTLVGYVALLVGFSGWAVLGLLFAAVPASITSSTSSPMTGTSRR